METRCRVDLLSQSRGANCAHVCLVFGGMCHLKLGGRKCWVLAGCHFIQFKRSAPLDMDVPKIGVPQNGWFIMENPIKMDDLGVPLFLETPIYFHYLCLPNSIIQDVDDLDVLNQAYDLCIEGL